MEITVYKKKISGLICLVMIGILGFLMPVYSQNSVNCKQPRVSVSKKNKSANLAKSKKKMIQKKTVEVAPGNWGGRGIGLTIEKNSARIEYDCAEAEINRKIMIDENGNFSVEGDYIRHSFGPVRADMPPERQPARFEGKISDQTMTLTVSLTGSKEKIGEFTLKLDQTARIRRCL